MGSSDSTLTLHMPIVSCYCSQYKSNAPKCFPLSLPFALSFFTLSCFGPITSHVMSTKGHITYQVGCAKGLVACYIPRSIPNMHKTCKTWTQNMSRNAEVKKKWGKGQTMRKKIAAGLMYSLH